MPHQPNEPKAVCESNLDLSTQIHVAGFRPEHRNDHCLRRHPCVYFVLSTFFEMMLQIVVMPLQNKIDHSGYNDSKPFSEDTECEWIVCIIDFVMQVLCQWT